MKIKELECWVQHFNLKIPYTIAYETISSVEIVFLKATADNGITAWGSAAPDKEITGETAVSVTEFFKNVMEPFLHNYDLDGEEWDSKIDRNNMERNPSACAMVDIMLHDLKARIACLPLYRYLGGNITHLPTSVTIGIMPVNEALEAARGFIKKGFKNLKIKGGQNYQTDIEIIGKIREFAGNKIRLFFDANQGYNLEEAIVFSQAVEKYALEFIEEPFPRSSPYLMGALRKKTSVSIMADESMMGIEDLEQMAASYWVDLINIKLMKVGGLKSAIKINKIAEANGINAMVGCMDESALSISAGLHLALANVNIKYIDLDGHLDLEGDSFTNCVKIKNGDLYPGSGIGLGTIGL